MIPSDVIKLDRNTKTFFMPTLLLMTRDFTPLGKISKYYNWNISLKANSIDEISFDVNKFYYDEYGNKVLCPVWDKLMDLKIVDVDGFGKFEISVSYTDNAETIKSIHGESLEVELGQLYLRDFHINDEEAITGDITEYNKMHFDADGNFIPTKFYNPNDTANSLLHRVLADKAPHWKIGYVTPYVSISEDDEAEKVEEFVRTYTVDGTSIYDFLTNDVATETNVVFLFDTNTRTINCYSMIDCYLNVADVENRQLVAKAIGEDTNILISKKKLANEIGIESNKDEIKNCFRVSGGDDLITSQVAAANMTGSTYIYQFDNFQLDDMPESLKNKLLDYQDLLRNSEDEYYGTNGIYTNLCDLYEQYNYLKSSMMPSNTLIETTAREQYNIVVEGLKKGVGVSTKNNTLSIVSNNVLAMAEVYVDSRYNVSLVREESSYDIDAQTWSGQISVVRATDESDSYTGTNNFTIKLYTNDDPYGGSDDGGLLFSKQKIDIALAKNDMTQMNASFDAIEDSSMSEEEKLEELKEILKLYCLERLKSFRDSYDICRSNLFDVLELSTSDIAPELYAKYNSRYNLADEIYQTRLEEVENIQSQIDEWLIEQADFQARLNLKNYLGDDYLIFCSYIREDEYTNSNYISDNLNSTAEYLAKAKELLDVASAQLNKACVIQRTVSTSLNNLLLLPEFEPLYDSFALFNYIRVVCEDEMFKLRILEISISGDSYADINVTYADEIESLDGTVGDLQSVLSQAASMSTSYDATMLQAKQGKEANESLSDMEYEGLDASTITLKSGDSDELTITGAGLIAKKMTDVGSYASQQLKITGNGIYMTDDNWNTIKQAIGEVKLDDETYKYGIVADNVIGKFILGENLKIESENTKVLINNNGITVNNSPYTVSLSPSDNKIFRVYQTEGTDEIDIMYVNNQGKGYFNGDLQAGTVTSINDNYAPAIPSTSTHYNDHYGTFVDADGDGIIYRTQPENVSHGSIPDIRTTTFRYTKEGLEIDYFRNQPNGDVPDIICSTLKFNANIWDDNKVIDFRYSSGMGGRGFYITTEGQLVPYV